VTDPPLGEVSPAADSDFDNGVKKAAFHRRCSAYNSRSFRSGQAIGTILLLSTGELVNGYWLVEAYASVGYKNPVPILLEPFSHQEPYSPGQNPVVLKAVERIFNITGKRGCRWKTPRMQSESCVTICENGNVKRQFVFSRAKCTLKKSGLSAGVQSVGWCCWRSW
jgi:hypothetical protein